MCLTISSPAFFNGATMPEKYTGNGENVSPPLRWRGLPEGTQELAIVCEDPDASSREVSVRWLVYKIPPEVTELPEHLPSESSPGSPVHVLQGRHSWPSGPKLGYRGPMSPPEHETHHYRFKLYALSKKLDLKAGADRDTLDEAMDGHILAESELIGTYG
ncbi:YbhB/YbcL family Raf kinase inhibitor-like protein [Roseiconus lacunae]|uniref:YbhB/YbcL family Raf kinase inhibitor-like protein n=1 Tax=Roseiconus lacunae TaxID=2605694 RepID=A0ABT7PC24_9BACT|nr:YbhB/YbcL family Raf kinase inhibitor-like protein [Roseiconus lacunae]MDM4014039.1 YbhB/YbcL family Raf kinase inhibitor-like protein [Roseiconus lacunae]